MRRLLTCLLLAISSLAFSQTPQPRNDHCFYVGWTYQMAATLRDSHMSPQQALGVLWNTNGAENIRGIENRQKAGITLEFTKKAINEVFFDPRFTYARGEVFRNQMQTLCLNPNGVYKPLK